MAIPVLASIICFYLLAFFHFFVFSKEETTTCTQQVNVSKRENTMDHTH